MANQENLQIEGLGFDIEVVLEFAEYAVTRSEKLSLFTVEIVQMNSNERFKRVQRLIKEKKRLASKHQLSRLTTYNLSSYKSTYFPTTITGSSRVSSTYIQQQEDSQCNQEN